MSTSNEIVLKGDYDRYEEAKINASATLKPGMLVELNSSGELIAQATTGKAVVTRVMLIDAFQGKTKTDAWTAGEVGRYYIPRAGDLLNLLALSGEDIDIGEQVLANNAGKVIATTGTPAKVLGVAEEDTGGALGADGFVAVRIN